MIGLLLATALAAQPSTAATEMLGTDVPNNFEVGYRAENAEQEIIEVVEPPETVENWTKLVTLQLFRGKGGPGAGEDFYGIWRNLMRNSCPGLTESSIRGTVDGKPAIRGSLSCPNNPKTGKPENLIAVVVEGDANLMMVQVAFKHPIGPKDNALVNRITGTLKVCEKRAFTACSARKPTGFIATAG